MKFKKTKKAYSMVEMATTVLIAGGLIIGTLASSGKISISAQNRMTDKRMEVVYEALGNFVKKNFRLPCPALPNIAKGGDGYGVEAATPGTCAGFTISDSQSDNQELVYGMVPIQALDLPTDMAEDGFASKFSYVVDRRFTKKSAGIFDYEGFEITQAVPSPDDPFDTVNIITVEDSSGSNLTTHALFALISHGANSSGAWKADSIAQTPDSGTAEEDNNSGSFAGGTTFTDIFVRATPPTSDDKILFKSKTQLVIDAGVRNIMCNGNEAKTSATPCDGYEWDNPKLRNANNDDVVCSNDGATAGLNCSRKCGKYGIWSSATSYINDECVDEGTLQEAGFCTIVNNATFTEFPHVTYLGPTIDVPVNQGITLSPNTGYCQDASPATFVCQSGGVFEISGNPSVNCCDITQNESINGGADIYDQNNANNSSIDEDHINVGETIYFDEFSGHCENAGGPFTAVCAEGDVWNNNGLSSYVCCEASGDDFGTPASDEYVGTANRAVGDTLNLTSKAGYCDGGITPTVQCQSVGVWSSTVNNASHQCCQISENQFPNGATDYYKEANHNAVAADIDENSIEISQKAYLTTNYPSYCATPSNPYVNCNSGGSFSTVQNASGACACNTNNISVSNYSYSGATNTNVPVGSTKYTLNHNNSNYCKFANNPHVTCGAGGNWSGLQGGASVACCHVGNTCYNGTNDCSSASDIVANSSWLSYVSLTNPKPCGGPARAYCIGAGNLAVGNSTRSCNNCNMNTGINASGTKVVNLGASFQTFYNWNYYGQGGYTMYHGQSSYICRYSARPGAWFLWYFTSRTIVLGCNDGASYYKYDFTSTYSCGGTWASGGYCTEAITNDYPGQYLEPSY